MLREKVKTAVLWSGVDTLIRQGFGFVCSVALARLLVPDDFGTVATLSIFIGVANLFVNAGLGLALIQRQDVTHVDESTVFWFNLGTALVMGLGLCFGAEWIAAFFGNPVLVPLTMVLAANIFIGALGTVHGTLITKRLDFKTPTKVGVASSTVGGFVGVYMAWEGFGLWALVGQTLASNILTVLLLWSLSSWRPSFVFSVASFRKLFKFGGWLFLSWLLDVVYQRGYTMLIGRFYGAHDLGIYNRADSTQSLASSALTDVLSKIAFPLFSAANNDPERMRRGVRIAVQTMMLITAPAMVGLAVLAKPFISVVFGDKWLAAAPILQVLCFCGLLYPLHVINLSVLQAQGHSNLFFRLELLKKLAGVALLVLGSLFGLLGIAVAVAVANLISFMINGFYTKKFLNYSVMNQMVDLSTSAIFALIMGVVILTLQSLFLGIGESTAKELLGLIAVGVVTYVTLNSAFKSEAYVRATRLVSGGRERRNAARGEI